MDSPPGYYPAYQRNRIVKEQSWELFPDVDYEKQLEKTLKNEKSLSMTYRNLMIRSRIYPVD